MLMRARARPGVWCSATATISGYSRQHDDNNDHCSRRCCVVMFMRAKERPGVWCSATAIISGYSRQHDASTSMINIMSQIV